jgi:ABC-2 type transport system ATP-binding protein
MTSVSAVKIDHLVKRFKMPSVRRQEVLAVDDISFEVASGEVYGLIGPNGSGKSTTMKVILGLLKPTSGTSQVYGIDSRHTESRLDVGFLPENPYFYKHMTGAETLSFYGQLCGLSGAMLRDRTSELLKIVDLEGARDRRLGGYSKGMLQRIGLAQALINRPRLVVLDEPTAGVDPAGSRKIRDLIFEMKEQGISVILSSHLLEQVQEVCDRVGIIFRGKMVREGSLSQILAIEDQTELVINHASPDLLAALEKLIAADGQAALSHTGRPRTTLEKLFLEVTGGVERGEIHQPIKK